MKGLLTLDEMIGSFPNLATEQLLLLNKASATAWSARNDEARKRFKKGDRVTFINTANNERMFGNVERKGSKNILIDCNGTTWRVSPAVLRKAN